MEQKKYLEDWDNAQKEAERLLNSLTKIERILIATSLYWGEGAKGILAYPIRIQI